MSKTTYADAGVDYSPIDAFKRYAQGIAAWTVGNILHTDVREVRESRGESVYLLELPDRYIAFVDEGLGTKHLVTQACEDALGPQHWHALGHDTVGMAVNDLITLGASPLTVSMHLQVGSSEWFSHVGRWQNLVRGWREACDRARCTWGPGETPVLSGVIEKHTCSLSSASVGMIYPKSRRVPAEARDGDCIVIIPSTGIHANGLSLARTIAGRLDERYRTRLPDGRSFGEALMRPTRLYARYVESCIKAGVRMRYMVNITGHGWRKIMRLDTDVAYEIDELPPVPPEFLLIQQEAGLSDAEMYETFNMGGGFALFVHPDDVEKALLVDTQFGFGAILAGRIQESDSKVVRIRRAGLPDIEFAGKSLAIR